MTAPESGPQTILDFIRVTAEHFKKNAVDDARLEAELLLAHAVGTNRVGLYVNYDRPLTTDEIARFRELVKRRGRHEPVAYILGVKEFWSLAFEVGSGILVPRPETECLVEEALLIAKALLPGLAGRPLRIADVGTGSGAIAVALAKELPQAEVWAGDIADGLLAHSATRKPSSASCQAASVPAIPPPTTVTSGSIHRLMRKRCARRSKMSTDPVWYPGRRWSLSPRRGLNPRRTSRKYRPREKRCG